MPELVTSTSSAAEIIDALSGFAWPAVALFALIVLRSDLSDLLARLRKGKGPAGIEFELDEAENSAREATDSLPASPSRTQKDSEVDKDVGSNVDETINAWQTWSTLSKEIEYKDGLLKKADQSPRGTLLVLAAEIEKRSREVLSTRSPGASTGMPFNRQIGLLELSPSLTEAAHEFRQVRNRIVHGGAASDAEVLRAVDIGLTILDGIARIPHEVNYVVASLVDCFSDAECQNQVEFRAVVLDAEASDGTTMRRAFPCQKNLPAGEPVSWEWGDQKYPETWYRDPETNDPSYGWTSALEFVGRPIHPGNR